MISSRYQDTIPMCVWWGGECAYTPKAILTPANCPAIQLNSETLPRASIRLHG